MNSTVPIMERACKACGADAKISTVMFRMV
jgi:hypothetical protein